MGQSAPSHGRLESHAAQASGGGSDRGGVAAMAGMQRLPLRWLTTFQHGTKNSTYVRIRASRTSIKSINSVGAIVPVILELMSARH